MHALRTTAALAVLILGLGAGAPALAQDVIVPADWAGIWQISSSIYDCDTDELLTSSTLTDTLCTGAVMDFPTGVEDFTIECTGSVEGNTMTVECTGSGEPEPGCTVDYLMTATTTRTGESYSGTTTITMTYGGICAILPATCMRIETTATRIAGEPGSCTGTAVETIPWGALKGIYR